MTHLPQLSHIHLQIVRNGSCNGRCLLHDAVQLIAAQHAGCKALFQLKDCSLRSLPGCAGERKLFVQLFCKLNDLLCVAKCAARHSAQLGNQTHGVHKIAAGTLRGLVDHRFQLLRGLQAIVHTVKPGAGRNQAV